jgi:transglutaminase-like putative cysteine protease
MTYVWEHFVDERVRYDATSVLAAFVPDRQPDRERNLALPEDLPQRIRELAAHLGEGKTREQALQSFMDHLKWGQFRYSMTSLPVSGTPLEDFLFEHKQGNCEYFASALAVLLRASGVPARLIGGYRGGTYNPTGGYYLVLQSHAHVWVEAYDEHRGWLRLDPTTPLRAIPVPVGTTRDVLMKLRLILDTFNYYWNKLVINYDFRKQVTLIRALRNALRKPRLEIDPRRFEWRRTLWIALALVLLGLVTAWVVFFCKDPPARMLARFLRVMSRHGYRKADHEGLEEFVARVEDTRLRQGASQFVEDFQSLYYRDRLFTRVDLRRIRERIRELR